MSFSFSDNFNRADAASLGSPWLESTNGNNRGAILNNHAVRGGAVGDSVRRPVISTGNTSQVMEAEATVADGQTVTDIEVMFVVMWGGGWGFSGNHNMFVFGGDFNGEVADKRALVEAVATELLSFPNVKVGLFSSHCGGGLELTTPTDTLSDLTDVLDDIEALYTDPGCFECDGAGASACELATSHIAGVGFCQTGTPASMFQAVFGSSYNECTTKRVLFIVTNGNGDSNSWDNGWCPNQYSPGIAADLRDSGTPVYVLAKPSTYKQSYELFYVNNPDCLIYQPTNGVCDLNVGLSYWADATEYSVITLCDLTGIAQIGAAPFNPDTIDPVKGDFYNYAPCTPSLDGVATPCCIDVEHNDCCTFGGGCGFANNPLDPCHVSFDPCDGQASQHYGIYESYCLDIAGGDPDNLVIDPHDETDCADIIAAALALIGTSSVIGAGVHVQTEVIGTGTNYSVSGDYIGLEVASETTLELTINQWPYEDNFFTITLDDPIVPGDVIRLETTPTTVTALFNGEAVLVQPWNVAAHAGCGISVGCGGVDNFSCTAEDAPALECEDLSIAIAEQTSYSISTIRDGSVVGNVFIDLRNTTGCRLAHASDKTVYIPFQGPSTGVETGHILQLDPDGHTTSTLWTPSTANEHVFAVATDNEDYVYALTYLDSASDMTLYKLSPLGVELDSWTLPLPADLPDVGTANYPEVTGMDVAPDGSKVYYSLLGNDDVTIAAYDLINDVALPDFVVDIGYATLTAYNLRIARETLEVLTVNQQQPGLRKYAADGLSYDDYEIDDLNFGFDLAYERDQRHVIVSDGFGNTFNRVDTLLGAVQQDYSYYPCHFQGANYAPITIQDCGDAPQGRRIPQVTLVGAT